MLSSPHSSPELVQLRKSETLTVFYHHDICIGHVYTYFYYYCRDEDIRLSGAKVFHGSIFFFLFHGPVNQAYLHVRIGRFKFLIYFFCGTAVYILRLFYEGSHHIGLSSFFDLLSDKIIYVLSRFSASEKSPYRPSSFRHSIYNRYVKITVQYHCQSPGDRSSRHHQDIGVRSLFCQKASLIYSESMLFVGDDKTQRFKLYVRLDYGVCAY